MKLIGFARESHTWSDARYQEIAKLARWIEANFGVPRKCSVQFVGSGQTAHLGSPEAVNRHEGHLGHQHVAGNNHWDPGRLKIDLILDAATPVVRNLARGDVGDDVKVLQSLLVKRGYTVLEPHVNGILGRATEAFVVHFQWHHALNIDGIVGPGTREALGLDATPAIGGGERHVLKEIEGLELGLGEPLADHVDVGVGEPTRATNEPNEVPWQG